MRVAVIGGYGVFGERLCRLLACDGHEVLVCGRNAGAAAALAGEIGASPLAMDREGDLAPLFGLKQIVRAHD
ncbi:MAG: NAD(P)-binding domain-containing protein [Pseudomonadota bacterium]